MDQQQQTRWRPTRGQLLWAGATVAALAVAILIGYRYGITLWDWIKILIVPATIAIGVAWLNQERESERLAQEAQREQEREAEAQQREREREATEEARREHEREAHAAHRERELEVENLRAQDEALQAYLNQMSQLLLDKDRPLRKSEEDSEERTLAQARTLTVLERLLDGGRKGSVVKFLSESKLIKDRVVLGLNGAHLGGAELIWVDLEGVDLRGADLSGTLLIDANLRGADLRGANLGGAYGWTDEQLRAASSLKGATMPYGQKYED